MHQESNLTDVLTPSRASRQTIFSRKVSARTYAALMGCLVLLLLLVLPPLISLNSYQRRVTTSMSQVLGRPVHLDRITLNLLPFPSFTLENLVIDEAPDFGAEPIIRANTVNARLRVSSLWRHRVEFSRITFNDPSVNLVHLRDGRWNLEGVLLQASRVDAAPTTQTAAGATPRFPYIEATGARVNLKLGQEKTPFSLTDADFALWLPQPSQWKLRIGGKPARTDTNVTDTGTIQIESTLNRASGLEVVPLMVDATWSDAPLGATSRIFSGHDAGLRGQMNLAVHLQGLLSAVNTHLHLRVSDLHRADFVPEHSLDIDVDCTALATHVVRSLENVSCSWPVPDSEHASIAVTGSVPNILHLPSAEVQIGTPMLPASVLVTWLHVLSARVPSDLKASGSSSGSVQYSGQPTGTWEGHARVEDLVLSGGHSGSRSIALGPVDVKLSPGQKATIRADLLPTAVPLGGVDPAVLEGSLSRDGYTLHLFGLVAIPRLLALGAAVPQFGDGLSAALPQNRSSAPTRLDLLAHRSWSGSQVWTETSERPVAPPTTTPTGSARRLRR